MADSNETLGFQMVFLVGRASGEWSETERIFSPRASTVTMSPPVSPTEMY